MADAALKIEDADDVNFDTHRAANRLKPTGMTDVQIDAFVDVLVDSQQKLVTKAEMDARFDAVDARFDLVDQRLSQTSTKEDLARLRLWIMTTILGGVSVAAGIFYTINRFFPAG